MLKYYLFFSIFFLISTLNAQEKRTFSPGSGNGLLQVYQNPALLSGGPIKVDVIYSGMAFNYQNSWFGVKKTSLGPDFKMAKPSSYLPDSSWENTAPGTANNIFKNLVFFDAASPKISFQSRIYMPSFMVNVTRDQTVFFTWSVRTNFSITGVNRKMTEFFKSEFDLSVTQNNPLKGGVLAASYQTWAEYGFGWAGKIYQNGHHTLRGGVTIKMLQGLQAAEAMLDGVDMLFSNKDTMSYVKTKLHYAVSTNTGPEDFTSLGALYHRVSKPSLGFDFGMVYEWRKEVKNAKGKSSIPRVFEQAAKFRGSLALTDIGGMKFEKEGIFYDLDVNLNNTGLNSYNNAKNFKQVDSLIRLNYNSVGQSGTFRMALPAALNIQADYVLKGGWHAALMMKFSGLRKANTFQVRDFTTITVLPGYEHKWFEFSVPLSYNTVSGGTGRYVMYGLSTRLGPVAIGFPDIGAFTLNDIRSLQGYIVFKSPIYYRKVKSKSKNGKDKNKY